MGIDITQQQRQIVDNLLKTYLPNTVVWVYGSRVKGTSTKYSDLDMVAFSTKEQSRAVYDLRDAFVESNLPFKVDFFVWDEIPDAFKENIKAEHVALSEQ